MPAAKQRGDSDISPAKAVPSFELVFRPSAVLISMTRRFVAEFYETVLEDRDVASGLALTTHELLENAAKYSIDGTVSLFVELDCETRTVVTRTRNRATPAQIALLQRWFDEIATAENADTLYAEMIKRTAARTTGSGGIGLARVYAETSMTLGLSIDGDCVTIEARGTVSGGG